MTSRTLGSESLQEFIFVVNDQHFQEEHDNLEPEFSTSTDREMGCKPLLQCKLFQVLWKPQSLALGIAMPCKIKTTLNFL